MDIAINDDKWIEDTLKELLPFPNIPIEELSRINEIRKFEKTRVFVDSSNVERVMYDSDTNELVVRFNSGETYTYSNITQNLFEKIIDGVDAPKTSGESDFGSWREGVGPSVGATVYERLVRRGVRYKRGGSFR